MTTTRTIHDENDDLKSFLKQLEELEKLEEAQRKHYSEEHEKNLERLKTFSEGILLRK